ncbi:mechanosensitive ion channel protein MscS [Wenyingzhuangia fucanilytica]|uniref:Mechanosensitive ion channel protein MscS n=1 Tax=Wenyingzhuangia fucanilytica TaxID=1790137 RepID=A0A1B1Y2P2_9FLAO|nr:mechanosensitive ion channel domain-containing protein [Wenyingzhuangia fucanilytica]ANW95020.1 mechanosensitive ion channel protein MscS [Wenyingzhuangia fucanilytica]
MDALNEFINIEIIKVGENSIKIFNLLLVLAIFVFTRLLVWIVSKIIHKRKDVGGIDHSNAYALAQISSYFLWVIGIVFMLEGLGIEITFLLAGSAALLVGIGLGLQQTFNDFISGLILLFEGTTKVGDILEIDNDVVKIQSIGLRTSKAINRYDISVIIPNSLITTNKVVNWSHHGPTTLFTVKVGVAYGSDVDLVIKVLKKCAEIHPEVIRKHEVDVRFSNFGASSLDFTVIFYTVNIFGVEKIKSEIRINIARAFKENGISVPFNQLDVHIKNKES